ncbi:hypothetical protein EQ500_07060 [Lactobacillus sp. XV13L]|nr:hypothetical protein [Lactobacillus sp. XV13L]
MNQNLAGGFTKVKFTVNQKAQALNLIKADYSSHSAAQIVLIHLLIIFQAASNYNDPIFRNNAYQPK